MGDSSLESQVELTDFKTKKTKKTPQWLKKTGLKKLPSNNTKTWPSKNPKTNQKCSANGISPKSNVWTWLWPITSNSTRATLNTSLTILPDSTKPDSRKPSAISSNDWSTL